MRRLSPSDALILMLLAAGLPVASEGQQRSAPAAGTPEQVTAGIVSAMRTQDWTALAPLMHPAALAELRSLFSILLESDDEGAAVARAQLFGVETAAEARALSDTMVFSRMMEAVMSQQELGAALATAEVTALGDVASLGRWGSTWRGLLKGDMRALAAGVRQAMLEGGGDAQ